MIVESSVAAEGMKEDMLGSRSSLKEQGQCYRQVGSVDRLVPETRRLVVEKLRGCRIWESVKSFLEEKQEK